jgi:hypothetical protein
MSTDDLFKPFRRFLYLFNHGMPDITYSNYIGIPFILLLALDCALLAIETWLIEVDILTHGHTLGGDEQLQQGGHFWVPILTGLASPCSQ